jgi:hypothetical protein
VSSEWRMANSGATIDYSLFAIRHSLFALPLTSLTGKSAWCGQWQRVTLTVASPPVADGTFSVSVRQPD